MSICLVVVYHMVIKNILSLLLVALCITSTGCAKLQNDRDFDTFEHALSFELESSSTASRMTATIHSEGSDTTLDVELTMSTLDSEYVSEPVHLEAGHYTISSLTVFDQHDTSIYSCTDLSIYLDADETVSLD